MFRQKIEGLSQKTELVILPEMFSTGFTMRPELLAETMQGPTLQWMKEMAARNRIILTGSMIIEEEKNFFNRLIWMLPTGEYGYYDKRHLFAYADEHRHYTAGRHKLITSVNGFKIHLQICYDLRFPVWSRQSRPPGLQAHALEYDLLINVASWPQKRMAAWKTLLRARAIENQCYVAGVNRVGTDGNGIPYSGGSTVIDALGEVMYEKEDAEDVYTCTLQKENLDDIRSRFPFLEDADDFFIK